MGSAYSFLKTQETPPLVDPLRTDCVAQHLRAAEEKSVRQGDLYNTRLKIESAEERCPGSEGVLSPDNQKIANALLRLANYNCVDAEYKGAQAHAKGADVYGVNEALKVARQCAADSGRPWTNAIQEQWDDLIREVNSKCVTEEYRRIEVLGNKADTYMVNNGFKDALVCAMRTGEPLTSNDQKKWWKLQEKAGINCMHDQFEAAQHSAKQGNLYDTENAFKRAVQCGVDAGRPLTEGEINNWKRLRNEASDNCVANEFKTVNKAIAKKEPFEVKEALHRLKVCASKAGTDLGPEGRSKIAEAMKWANADKTSDEMGSAAPLPGIRKI